MTSFSLGEYLAIFSIFCSFVLFAIDFIKPFDNRASLLSLLGLISLIVLMNVKIDDYSLSHYNRGLFYLYFSLFITLLLIIIHFLKIKFIHPVFFLPIVLIFVISFIVYSGDKVNVASNQQYLLFFHISFCLFAYICSLCVFILSLSYSILYNMFKKKKIVQIINKFPPLMTQYRQIDLFLLLTISSLFIGLFFGFLWALDSRGEWNSLMLKAIVSLIGLFSYLLLYILRQKGWNNQIRLGLTSVGAFFLLISLFVEDLLLLINTYL